MSDDVPNMKEEILEWLAEFDKATKSYIEAVSNAQCVDKDAISRDFYDNYYERFEEAWDADLLDPSEGFLRLDALAKIGFPWSFHDMGEAFLAGKGCKRDTQVALLWIDKALESGMYVSEEIGDALRLGERGLPLDFDRAWRCYRSDSGNHKFDLQLDEYYDRNDATLDWWEYAAAQVAPTLKLCEWMKEFYKPGDPKRDKWIIEGVTLCLKDRKCLDEKHIEDTMLFLTEYLRESRIKANDDGVNLAVQVIDCELHTMGCDDDFALEGLLDAFFGVQGYEDDKKRLWDKIDNHCNENAKFRNWAGRRRFDRAESRLRRCSGCGRELKCADVSCPSDIFGQIDQMPFCRDCYGQWFYMSYGGGMPPPEYRFARSRDDKFPDGIDDGFRIS